MTTDANAPIFVLTHIECGILQATRAADSAAAEAILVAAYAETGDDPDEAAGDFRADLAEGTLAIERLPELLA